MAVEKYRVELEADASKLVSTIGKATRSTRDLGKAQDFLNNLTMRAAAAESPLQAIRVKAAQDLARLNQLYKSGAITIQQYNTAVNQVVRTQKLQAASMTSGIGAFKNMRGAMGQFGYQVQDIAVQLQMGQNAMLVFAQQGSQIASIFGPHGQVIGAIIAVAGALAMSFIPSLEETKQTADELLDEINELAVGYGNLSMAAQTYYQVKLNQQIREQTLLVDRLTSSLRTAKSNQLESVGPVDPEGVAQTEEQTVSYTGKVGELTEEQKLLNQQLQAENQILYNLKVQLGNLDKPMSKWMMTIDQSQAFVNDLSKKVSEYGKTDLEIMRMNLEKLQPEQKAVAEGLVREYAALKEADNALKDYAEAGKTVKEALIDVTAEGIEGLEDSLVDLISGTKSASEAFKDMARSIIADLIRMQVQTAITKPLAGMMNSFFTGTQTNGASVEDHSIFTAPGKAIGGPVSANTPYMVGEKGPEMFIPNGAGKIVKNSDLGGGSTIVNQTINISTGVSQTVRAEIANMLPQIANAAKSAVADARQRGGGYSKALVGA